MQEIAETEFLFLVQLENAELFRLGVVFQSRKDACQLVLVQESAFQRERLQSLPVAKQYFAFLEGQTAGNASNVPTLKRRCSVDASKGESFERALVRQENLEKVLHRIVISKLDILKYQAFDGWEVGETLLHHGQKQPAVALPCNFEGLEACQSLKLNAWKICDFSILFDFNNLGRSNQLPKTKAQLSQLREAQK